MDSNTPSTSGSSIPSTVEGAEELGHGIYTSSEKKRAARGEIPYSVFHERVKNEISVDRLTYAPDDVAESLGDQRAVGMGTNRSFYGWAAIKASKAASSDRRVQASALSDGSNPYHADILLPDIVNDCKAIHEFHTQELAESACWKARS